MISGENLQFCAADSNKYIGRIHHCSSFFSHILHRISEIPISAESYICVPKNVRISMLSTIGRESCPVNFACTMQTYKWRVRERKWRENGEFQRWGEMEREISSLSMSSISRHVISIFSLSLHFLSLFPHFLSSLLSPFSHSLSISSPFSDSLAIFALSLHFLILSPLSLPISSFSLHFLSNLSFSRKNLSIQASSAPSQVHLIFYSIWRENIFARIVPKGPSCRTSGIKKRWRRFLNQ